MADGVRPQASGLRPPAGWGIDACLTAHVDGVVREGYLALLQESGVGVLRERGPNEGMKDLKSASHFVVSFLDLQGTKVTRAANHLPEDLLEVFKAASEMARKHRGVVDAWEMVGEPDVGYCTDLPDRVAAFQKAVYLGIRHGAAARVTSDEWRVTSTVAEGGGREPEAGGRRPEAGGRTADGGRPSIGFAKPGGQTVAGDSPETRPLTSDVRPLPSAPSPAPLVLMGALALPPGPWLERAARNGILDYTDGYNFHFYGHARDLSGVIAAHRRAAAGAGGGQGSGRRERVFGTGVAGPETLARSATGLPLWITECGINAVTPTDFLNPQRRKLQAEFTLATARQALRADDVAVFMPFILAHENDPHALTLSADKPLPAWEAYAKFTRERPWPNRALGNRPADPNPVVVQWLPDNMTAAAHKVSGSYRFRGTGSIQGELRIFNLSETSRRGLLRVSQPAHFRQEADIPSGLELAPMSVRIIPITFIQPAVMRGAHDAVYFREDWHAAFVEEDGRASPVAFAVETVPTESSFRAGSLALARAAKPKHPMYPEDRVTSRSGAWIGMNGVLVEEVEGRTAEDRRRTADYGGRKMEDGGRRTEDGRRRAEDGGRRPEAGDLRPETGGRKTGTRIRVAMKELNPDPLRSKTAVARLSGLPADGFIRLRLDRPMDRDFMVRVDLLDRKGQRFTIWENFGVSYFAPKSTDVWLNLRDFHPYFWGRCTEDPVLRPAEVEEMQLRFYISKPNDAREIEVSIMRAR